MSISTGTSIEVASLGMVSSYALTPNSPQNDRRHPRPQSSKLSGPTLVAWEHRGIPTIVSYLGQVTPPTSWPDSVFDTVFVFTCSDSGWNFAQVPQMLLAGDSTEPIA
jgi:hypothetical protein